MKNFVLKIILFSSICYAVWFSFIKWGERFYIPPDYVSWERKYEIISDPSFNPKDIVIGDSLTEAAINPIVISDDLYNLAYSGYTPVYAYFFLKKYFELGKRPKRVILGFGITNWQKVDMFREHIVAFSFLTMNDFNEILETTQENSLFYDPSDSISFFKDWIPFSYFFNDLVKKYQKQIAVLDFVTFKLGINPILISHIKSYIFDTQRSKFENQKRQILLDIDKMKGHRKFYKIENVDVVNPIAVYDQWYVNDAYLTYFRKIKQLTDEYGAELKIFFVPNNMTSWRNFTPKFHEDMKNYFERSPDWIGVVPDNDLLGLEIEYMVDMDHVNEKGMLEVSRRFKDIYYPKID